MYVFAVQQPLLDAGGPVVLLAGLGVLLLVILFVGLLVAAAVVLIVLAVKKNKRSQLPGPPPDGNADSAGRAPDGWTDSPAMPETDASNWMEVAPPGAQQQAPPPQDPPHTPGAQ